MMVSAVDGAGNIPGALEVASANRATVPPNNAMDVAQTNLNSRVSANAFNVAAISMGAFG